MNQAQVKFLHELLDFCDPSNISGLSTLFWDELKAKNCAQCCDCCLYFRFLQTECLRVCSFADPTVRRIALKANISFWLAYCKHSDHIRPEILEEQSDIVDVCFKEASEYFRLSFM